MWKCKSPIWSRGFATKISVKIIGGLNSKTLFQWLFYLYSFSVLNLDPEEARRYLGLRWGLKLLCYSCGPKNLLLVAEKGRIWTFRTEILYFPVDQLRAFAQNTGSGRLGIWSKPLISNALIIDAGFCQGLSVLFATVCEWAIWHKVLVGQGSGPQNFMSCTISFI